MSKRNIIKGQDKDIGYWIKGDWDSFKKFIDNNSAVITKRQAKVDQKKDSIVVYKDDNKRVVIPLTKEASIQYGKNTSWCTAYTEVKNHFIDYFYMKKVTLFYVLFKDGNKYACAFHPKQSNKIECFDQADRIMHFNKFEEVTGISMVDMHNWYNSNKTKIEDIRNLNKCSDEFQIAVVKDSWRAIGHIKNPSVEVQLAAIKTNAEAIKYIVKKAIVPSEEVQLAAVSEYGGAIEYIDNPTEKAQLAAVTQNGLAIKHIDNPSEEVQLAAVKQTGYAIKHIANPSEELQLAAVNRHYGAIEYIIDNGIVPSEEVQLDVVTKAVERLGI